MVSIKAEKREITGKRMKALRAGGKIPAVLYGRGKESISLEIPERAFSMVFKLAGESTLVDLELGGEKRNVLIHDVAFDPVKDNPIHIDFLEVRMDKLLRAKIQLVFEGESPAIKSLGGVLVKVMHELEVEALPKDLPHEVKIDISKLANLEDRFTVADLKLPDGVKAIAKPDDVLALIETPRAEEVVVETAPSLETIEVTGGKKKAEKEGEGEEAPDVSEKKQEKKQEKISEEKK